jgi:hypothetical protein
MHLKKSVSWASKVFSNHFASVFLPFSEQSHSLQNVVTLLSLQKFSSSIPSFHREVLKDLVRAVRPTRLVYVAEDGTPPFANELLNVCNRAVPLL